MHEWHAEVAEYRLRHQGVLPELLLYLEGIGRASRWVDFMTGSGNGPQSPTASIGGVTLTSRQNGKGT